MTAHCHQQPFCQTSAAFPETIQDRCFPRCCRGTGTSFTLGQVLSVSFARCHRWCLLSRLLLSRRHHYNPTSGQVKFPGKDLQPHCSSLSQCISPDYHLAGASSWGLSPSSVGLQSPFTKKSRCTSFLHYSHLLNNSLFSAHLDCWLIFFCCC